MVRSKIGRLQENVNKSKPLSRQGLPFRIIRLHLLYNNTVLLTIIIIGLLIYAYILLLLLYALVHYVVRETLTAKKNYTCFIRIMCV